MTNLVIAKSAKVDISNTIDYLEQVAGGHTADRYARQIQDAVNMLVAFPESGAPRPVLGETTRMVVIYPYLMLYDYEPSTQVLTILRLLHGRTSITIEDMRRT